MQINQLKDLLKGFDKNVIYDQDLKKKSWFNIGGKSKVFYKAENLRDLVKFLKLLDNNEKIFIAGANGMVGKSLVSFFKNKNFGNLILVSRKKLDLENFIKVNSMKKIIPLQKKVYELDLASKGLAGKTKDQFWQDLDNVVIELTAA